jgi:hypothetical protein
VLRACHRWLLDHDTDYRHERLTIETWMEIHHIPPGQLDSAVQRPADTADRAPSTPSTPSTPKQTSTPSTPKQTQADTAPKQTNIPNTPQQNG